MSGFTLAPDIQSLRSLLRTDVRVLSWSQPHCSQYSSSWTKSINHNCKVIVSVQRIFTVDLLSKSGQDAGEGDDDNKHSLARTPHKSIEGHHDEVWGTVDSSYSNTWSTHHKAQLRLNWLTKSTVTLHLLQQCLLDLTQFYINKPTCYTPHTITSNKVKA